MAASQFRGVQRTKSRDGAIGQHDFLFENVIDGLAVEDRARAAGIIRHHAADRGAAGGGNIRRKTQPVGTQRGIQFVEHDARLHADPALFDIEFEDLVVIFRSVDLQARADGLAGLRGAAAAQRDGAAKLAGDAHDADQVFARFGDHDAEGLDLIDAGVGGIEGAGDGVEADFAFDLRFQFALQSGGIDKARVGVGHRGGGGEGDEAHKRDNPAYRYGSCRLGAVPEYCLVAVGFKVRRISATLHAWAKQPRGSCGASPSKISGIWPVPRASTNARSGSSSSRARPRDLH